MNIAAYILGAIILIWALSKLIEVATAVFVVGGLVILCVFILYYIFSKPKQYQHLKTQDNTSKESKTTFDSCQHEQPDDNSAQKYWHEVINPRYNSEHESNHKTENMQRIKLLLRPLVHISISPRFIFNIQTPRTCLVTWVKKFFVLPSATTAIF